MSYKDNSIVIVYIIEFPDTEYTEHTSNGDPVCMRLSTMQ